MTSSDLKDGIAVIEGITRECYRSFGLLPNARVIDAGGIFGVITDVPIPFFSGVAMSHVQPEEVERGIELFRGERRPFRWWISPSTEPAGLVGILPAHGMRHAYDSAGMTADLTSVPLDKELPKGLSIERVTDLASLKTFFDIFIVGFSRPDSETPTWLDAYAHFGFDATSPWTYYIGWLDGTPVATTAVLHCGDFAGIYHVVTLPPWRGRGIGAAVTRAAMNHAHECGARSAALQASEMGYSVYRALGFVEYCQLTLYDWRPEYDT